MGGTGDYRLAASHKQFWLSKTDSVNKTNSQRQKALKKFRNYNLTPKKVMISIDGQSEIIAPRTHDKKLNQDTIQKNTRGGFNRLF